MRRLSGTRRFDGNSYRLMGTIANKRTAQQIATAIRSRNELMGGRKYSYNARVVPIKSRGGYGVYIQPTKRKYSYTRIPWRDFQDGRYGIDVVMLNSWLQNQVGHNPNLNWRENLRNIGGAEAVENLDKLMDPTTAIIEQKQAEEASFDFASMLDGILEDTDLGQSAGFEARSREDYKTEMGGGFSEDFLLLEGPEEQRALVAQSVQEADIFDFLEIDDGVQEIDDTDFLRELDEWFERELSDVDLLPERVGETYNETRNTLNALASEELEAKQGETLDSALDRILNESFDEILRNELSDDDGTLTFGSRTFSPDDIFSEATLNPSLGFSQPETPAGSPAGYWTYRPLGNLGTVQPDQELFAKRDVFMVADSLGNIVSTEFYERGNQASERAAVRAASGTAKLLTSQFDMYKTDTYQDYGRVAPGLVILDGTITIDRAGLWAGYEIVGRDEDYTIGDGDFELYIDGAPAPPGSIPASTIRNWILPQTKDNFVDSARERAEFLGVDFEGARNQNALALAELARQSGSSAQVVNDLLNNTKYRIYDLQGSAVSTTLPDWETVLKIVKDFQSQGRQEAFVISKSKANALGEVSRLDEERYANALYDPAVGYVFNYEV